MTAPKFKLLLVDDDTAQLRLLSEWLQLTGLEVSCANCPDQAVARIESDCPNLLLLSWAVESAVDLCRWIREQDLPHYVYVLAMIDCESPEALVLPLSEGADDAVRLPLKSRELIARVQSASRILELERHLKLQAGLDSLTGLPTRRALLGLLEAKWRNSSRQETPLACAMVDLDFFKSINDTYGHAAGDQVLKGAAKIIQSNARPCDLIARYGGEEFCVILAESTESEAEQWAIQVCRQIEESSFDLADATINVTASIGVAQRLADTHTGPELIDLADQALLVAKRSGRNRVETYHTSNIMQRSDDESAVSDSTFSGVLARDVMSTVNAGLNENEPIGYATESMLKLRTNHAPVVDDNGHLVGILSERELMAIMSLPTWSTLKIKDVMNNSVVCYEEDTPVVTIYEFLCRAAMQGVVIVKNGKPIGIISRISLLRWSSNRAAAQSQEDRSCQKSLATGMEDLQGKVLEVAAMLTREAQHLEQQLEQVDGEIVPTIVGGASRLEELIGDLLAHSREASSLHALMRQVAVGRQQGEPQVARGLMAALEMNPNMLS